MLHEKALKKVEKALDVKVELIGNTRYGCTYEGYVLSWLVSRQWKVENDKIEEDGPLEAHNWHVRKENDHSDSMTDYYAGSFFDNVTQLINYVKPPEAKFPAGSLVRGKDNKRANRLGYANRLALVLNAGRYMKLSFTDGDDGGHPTYVTYCERDFVRIS